MKKYDPKAIEPKWQKHWDKTKLYAAKDFDEKRPKYVMLTEFPYPSGVGIHLGHVREYTLGDILARRKRMEGHNVLYPMGYDEFGLPTENYAIKNKMSPQKATQDNVAAFQRQLESMGYGFDWTRKVSTSDPNYYKWTQWLFLRFFEAGLAYQDEIAINWCSHCKTGLSNEEVVNGRHERCDTLVDKKTLKQWMLAITKYADRLIEGLKEVDYPSNIADQQINWIGRKTGIDIDYKLTNAPNQAIVSVFTTRPDTNFGATFVVVAPEHPLVQRVVAGEIEPTTGHSHREEVAQYVQKSITKSEIERQEEGRKKTGAFTGFYAKNELTGQDMPVWVSDFVLAGFGTGALVGVPGHDRRDFEFAREFDLPIVRVVVGSDADKTPITRLEQVQEKQGTMVNSEFLNGADIHSATQKMMDYMEAQGMGRRKVSYRLRDWIFSRQHYWGEPIPIIHCGEHGAVSVPDEDLPVELPKVDHYEPTDTGESPLAAIEEWVNVVCPACGKPAKRETDTMPNWAGSSWYYLRYYDALNDQAFGDRRKLDYWGAVDMYLGGMEHTTLHLLYSRFWHQFLYDEGLVPTPEPYLARRGQGIILATDNTKMSKSKGNVVDPTTLIDEGYGADALRLAITFLAPYDQTTPWNANSIDGTKRFLNRVWALVQEHVEAKKPDAKSDLQLPRITHKTIKKVTQDLEGFNFNTAIAAMMEAINELYLLKIKHPLGSPEWGDNLKLLVQILAPFAPHISEELWQQLEGEGSVHISAWPAFDADLVVDDIVTIVLQVNGKLRGKLDVDVGTSEDEIKQLALADESVARHAEGKRVLKTIYVSGRLVNFVIK